MENLDLYAEAAGGPLLIEEMPDGNSLALVASVISTLVTYATAAECLGSVSTITSLQSFSSAIGG
jgi:hypothetical protein